MLALLVALAQTVRLTADLQRSREQLVRAREEERRRLRRDLHDGLGPTVAAGILQMQVAQGLIRTDAVAAEALLGRLVARAQELIDDIRRLVDGQGPHALDHLGLVSAIKERAAHFATTGSVQPEKGTLQVKIETEGIVEGLPAAVEVAAYHIVSEALNNASRHGRASTCSVRLATDGADLTIEVADDGCGIGADSRPGVGLASMRERTDEFGGTVTVEPSTSGGTAVRAHLPLPERDGSAPSRRGRRPPVRPEGLRLVLSSTGETEVAGEASTGTEAIAYSRCLPPH